MSDEKRNVPAKNNTDKKSVQLHDTGLKAGSLLDQSLAQLTKEQTRNLMAKAGEEALRLEVKMREQNIEYVSGKKHIEDHIDTFNMLDKSGKLSSQKVISDVKTGAGNMRIESKSGRACFVATVAYGDGNHPDVVYLRRFRDEVILNSYGGISFINWYWRMGPHLARIIGHSPRMTDCARWLISHLVSLLRKYKA